MPDLFFNCEKCGSSLQIKSDEFKEASRDSNYIYEPNIECPICKHKTNTIFNNSEKKAQHSFLKTVIACVFFGIFGLVIGYKQSRIEYKEAGKTNRIAKPDEANKKELLKTANKYVEAIENSTKLKIGELQPRIDNVAVFVNFDQIANALISKRSIADSIDNHLNKLGIEAADNSEYSLNYNVSVLEMRSPQLDLYITFTDVTLLRRVYYFDQKTTGEIAWYEQPAEIWSSRMVRYNLPVDFNEKLILEDLSQRMKGFSNDLFDARDKIRRTDK